MYILFKNYNPFYGKGVFQIKNNLVNVIINKSEHVAFSGPKKSFSGLFQSLFGVVQKLFGHGIGPQKPHFLQYFKLERSIYDL